MTKGPLQLTEEQKAWAKVLRLLNVRERSTFDIRERLAQDGYPDELIERCIERACEYGFVDDKRYARMYVRAKVGQGYGQRIICRNLEKFNLTDDEVAECFEEAGVIEEDDEFNRALAFLRRKPPRSKNIREGAYRKLAQHGFSSSIASSVARVYSEECSA